MKGKKWGFASKKRGKKRKVRKMTQKEALQKVSEKKVKIGDLAPNLGSGEMGKWPQCGEMGKKREFWLGKEIKRKSGQKDPQKKTWEKMGEKS